MNYARRFAWHAASTVGTAVIGGAFFYVLRIVLYQRLPQEDYGLFYVAFSYATIIQTVITFGFDPGLVPYVTRYREENDSDGIKSAALGVLVPQAVLTGIVVVGFFVLPPLLASWSATRSDAQGLLRVLTHPASPVLFRILAVHAVFVLLFKCGQQVLLGLQGIAWRNASDLARAAVCLAAAYALLQMGWGGVRATAAAYTLGALAEAAAIGAALLVSFPHVVRARFTWRPRLVREIFDSGKWLSIGFGGIVIFSSVDTVVISMMRKDFTDAAAYQVALPTITILYSLMIAAGITLLPTVRTLWLRGEHGPLADGIQRLYAAAIVLILPAGVLLACSSDVLMTALFGPNILNAPEAFDVLAVGGIVFFLAYVNLHVLAGIDQPRAAGVVIMSGLAVDLLLNFPLTYWFGIRGTAIAGVCGYGVAAIFGLLALRRLLHFPMPVRAVTGSAILSVGVGLISSLLRYQGYIGVDRPLQSAVSGLLLFLCLVWGVEFIGFIELRNLLRKTNAVDDVAMARRKS